jgi:2'-phosphotransferase
MGRNHVHFATGLPTGFNRLVETSGEEQVEEPAPVISGMRNSSTVLIYVDLKKAIDMGLQFWFSANGVVLCDGGENGLVPVECFESVEDRGDGGTLLLKNGAVVGELSEKRKKKGAWQSSS